MPNFEYIGPGGPRTYPETRDAYGVNLGTVKPGDVLEFAGHAPDQFWAPYEEGQGGTEAESGEPPADPETPQTAPQDVPPGE
jgi:hypothetical protein